MLKPHDTRDPSRQPANARPDASSELKAALTEAQVLLDAAHVLESTLLALARELSAERTRRAVNVVRDRAATLAISVVRVSGAIERLALRAESHAVCPSAILRTTDRALTE